MLKINYAPSLYVYYAIPLIIILECTPMCNQKKFAVK
jgi:hypothetical protein